MNTLRAIWKLPDLRRAILYVFGMLFIFRAAAHVPIPGVDAENLRRFFASNQLLGLLNLFSGGGLEQFSVVSLGIAPYITASIIFQLLTMIIPPLEAISKEGEMGMRRINQYTRIATVPLAAIQGYGFLTLLSRSAVPILRDLTVPGKLLTVFVMTAGTIFLMWIGELVSEKHVGNGISLLIFAGIISNLPKKFQQLFLTLDATQLFTLIAFILIGLATIAGVVYITEAQRNIPVSYARVVRGNRLYGGVNTHLPLRVTQAGVIPIIFAISILLFPPTIAQFFLGAKSQAIRAVAQGISTIFQNQILYGILYFFLVVAFTYFYTAIIFQPDKIAENLQKQGGFIPGIRPGRPTSEYLGFTVNRVIIAGALFLGVIAVLPLVVQSATGIQAFTVGGTSLLIVVSVVIESIKQIQAQLVMREYEGF